MRAWSSGRACPSRYSQPTCCVVRLRRTYNRAEVLIVFRLDPLFLLADVNSRPHPPPRPERECSEWTGHDTLALLASDHKEFYDRILVDTVIRWVLRILFPSSKS